MQVRVCSSVAVFCFNNFQDDVNFPEDVRLDLNISIYPIRPDVDYSSFM